MSGPIVITVPTKYIPVNLAPAPVKLEIMPSPSTNGSDAEESTSSIDEYLVRGKKRRLDHLTWEEKLQRKKLKNRVAAQTSRDRKKAKMEDMELTIQQQTDQINQLQEKCESLQLEKDAIYSKYLDLESRFEDLQHQFEEQRKQQQTAIGPITIKSEPDLTGILHSVGCVSTLTGSAASAYFPLQQGSLKMETQTTVRQNLKSADNDKVASLWRIIALCLLYRTYSKNSMCPNSKSSPKAFWPTSRANWKSLIEEAARQMPKMQAPAAECLDQWWGPHQNSWNPAKKLIKEVA